MEYRGAWLGDMNTDDTPALRSAGFTVDEKQGITQGNIFLRVGVAF
jgi:hypothetical protein